MARLCSHLATVRATSWTAGLAATSLVESEVATLVAELSCEFLESRATPPGIESPLLEASLFPRVHAELATGIEPMQGTVDLLEMLAGRVPLGVASNSHTQGAGHR